MLLVFLHVHIYCIEHRFNVPLQVEWENPVTAVVHFPVNIQDSLMACAKNDDIEKARSIALSVIRPVVKYSAKVNVEDSRGQTALHYAELKNPPDVIKLLIKHRADINRVDTDGLTLLHYAILEQLPEVVKVLINHGADVNSQTNYRQYFFAPSRS